MYNQKVANSLKAAEARGVAETLSRVVNVNTNSNPVVAGVSKGAIDSVFLGSLEPIIIQHTAGTADEIIKVGDPADLVGAANNIGTISKYSDTVGSTWDEGQIAEIAREGFTIKELNYQTDDSTQFASPFLYATTDASRSQGAKRLQGRLVAAQRSTDQNLLIKTLDLNAQGGQLLIDRYNALFLTVAAGNTVTLTITMGGVVE